MNAINKVVNAINKVVKKMNFYVQQSITIQYLKVNAVTNSSVLQIGSSGIIKPTTHLYNTGGSYWSCSTNTKPYSNYCAYSAVYGSSDITNCIDV